MARAGGAITIDFDEESVLDRLQELTAGKGPDKCIDAVGMEAHALRSLDSMIDRVKQAVMIESDRPHVLREMMYVCRPAGTLSVPGVYGGMVDKIPFGAAMNKGLTIRTGQTHVKRWTDDLLQRIEDGQIDPSFVITHTVKLEDGPDDVQDLPRQGGRLHQGRHEAMSRARERHALNETRHQHPAPDVPCPAEPAARADARRRRARSAGSASASAWPSWRCRERSRAPPACRTCRA